MWYALPYRSFVLYGVLCTVKYFRFGFISLLKAIFLFTVYTVDMKKSKHPCENDRLYNPRPFVSLWNIDLLLKPFVCWLGAVICDIIVLEGEIFICSCPTKVYRFSVKIYLCSELFIMFSIVIHPSRPIQAKEKQPIAWCWVLCSLDDKRALFFI